MGLCKVLTRSLLLLSALSAVYAIPATSSASGSDASATGSATDSATSTTSGDSSESVSAAFAPSGTSGSYTPKVSLSYATYQGYYNSSNDISYFYGIRYADPPTGSNRWKAPKAPSTTRGVTAATAFAPACPQGAWGAAPTAPSYLTSNKKREVQDLEKREPHELSKRAVTISEDCLFLTVLVSGKVQQNKNLPVVIWIHGGGFVNGNTASYPGEDLIGYANGGVIVVEIQFRLGMYGYLAGSQVKSNGGVANAALRDQEFAFKWVQNNIAKFGGNKNHVTIWGESSGAGAVYQHLVAYGGRNGNSLFNAAISSSPRAQPQYKYNDQVPQALYNQAVSLAGCSNARNTFTCLQGLSLDALEAINVQLCKDYFWGEFTWVPVIDGTYITDRPYKTIQSGRLNGNYLLSFNNQYEGKIFIDQTTISNLTIKQYVQNLFPTITSSQAQQIVNQYTSVSSDKTTQALTLYGESQFICPAILIAQYFPGNKWKGQYAVPPGEHGQDLGYYFYGNTVGEPAPIWNQVFADSFSGQFMGFVKSYNPNNNPQRDDVTPNWSQYSTYGNTEMVYNITASTSQPYIYSHSVDSGIRSRCSFWTSFASSLPH